jgi:hypothetical protein
VPAGDVDLGRRTRRGIHWRNTVLFTWLAVPFFAVLG